MKKYLLYALLVVTASASAGWANTISLDSYYPSPIGIYDELQTYPQPAITPSNNCLVGSLYTNISDDGRLYYCSPNAPTNLNLNGTYGPFPGVWTISGNNVYLSDTASPASKRVVIGGQTPTLKLTLLNDGGLLALGTFGAGQSLSTAGAGARLIWYPRKAAFRAGHVNSTQWDDVNIGNYSVALGLSNTASQNYSIAIGGQGNISSNANSAVFGGNTNNVSGSGSIIIGGSNNINSGDDSFVAGWRNEVSGLSTMSTISGGNSNRISANQDGATISGGHSNLINSPRAVISGGIGNLVRANGSYGTILGGASNSGGEVSLGTPGRNFTIGGGFANLAAAEHTTISGGSFNDARSSFSLVSGGQQNKIQQYVPYGAILGGTNNTIITGDHAAIAGGNSNKVDADYAIIGGGNQNEAIGGVSGTYGVVPGGANNFANASFSFAAGRNMQLTSSASQTFVWGHSSTPVSIATSNAFIIYSGRVGIQETAPHAVLEVKRASPTATDDFLAISLRRDTPGNIFRVSGNGRVSVGMQADPSHPLQFGNGAHVSSSGEFRSTSSRALKKNIQTLETKAAQQTLAKLNPVIFRYKKDLTDLQVGFIAEDVPDLVATNDRKGVSPLEITAVLTKIIQNQEETLRQQEELQQSLITELKTLKALMTRHD